MNDKDGKSAHVELDLWAENLRECERLCPNPGIEVSVCPIKGLEIGKMRKSLDGGETTYIFDVREYRLFIKHDSRKFYPPFSDSMALMIYCLLGLNGGKKE